MPPRRTLLVPLILLPLLALLLCPGTAAAYVGPGAGFGLAGSLLAVLNALLATAGSLAAWPVLAAVGAVRRSRRPLKPVAKRVVVLGFDGLSPDLVSSLASEGELPALASLACSIRMETTVPGISPVAWSTFQTGVDPGGHGIFDFLAPDRLRYLPRLSSVSTSGTTRGRARIRLLRRSRPFWSYLGRYGLGAVVIRVPVTYPPEKLSGSILSGMCVPDLRGTQGTYTLFGEGSGRRLPGGVEAPLSCVSDGVWKADLEGPPGMKPVAVTLRRSNGGWLLGVQGASTRLEPGLASGWVSLRFGGRLRGARGIASFLLKLSEDGKPSLYCTAVHPDPWSPPVPISHPPLYSKYLAGLLGPFATMGLAEDTWALSNSAIDEQSFLDQCWRIFGERRAMLLDAMRSVSRGLVLCVMDTSDRIQHMFWRQGSGPGSAIREMYRRMDAMLAEVLRMLGDDDLLIVLSDHGFTSFDWCVDLNRWLVDSGFMTLEDGVQEVEDSFRGVDWSRTAAYSLGLAGIFLNLKGREASGIVEPAEAPVLADRIASALLDLKGPDGSPAVLAVHRSSDVYHGPYSGDAPELIVGMRSGFRAAWNSATGGIGRLQVYRNELGWSGDHCQDSSLVPAFLGSNRMLETRGATMADMAPTILSALGIRPPAHMRGRSLLERER